MKLNPKQFKFTYMIAELILWAYSQGYTITWGEAYRTPGQAKRNATLGVGIENSLHTKRLAADLMLFKSGKYLTKTVQYKRLGEHWEQMGEAYGVPTRWGGRFGDGNHFSVEHLGVK